MVTKKRVFIAILALMALGMVGVLLLLAASTTPAAPLIPSNHLTTSDVSVDSSVATIKIDDARWVTVAGTKSMEPVLMEGAQVLERVPSTASELKVGDIITYDSAVKNLPIIHRIVEIGSDQYGWYAKTKGDNAQNVDDESVRFPQVSGVVVAIIY